MKLNIDSLAQALPGVIYRIDLTVNAKGKVIFLNSQIEDISGYSADDFLSGSVLWFDLILPEDLLLVRKFIHASLKGKPYKIEYRIRHKDGTIRWVLNQGYITVVNRKPTLSDGVILDVTESKLYEQQLAYQQKEMSNLVASLDDIVFLIDVNGRFKNCYTRDWQKLFGPPSSFLNKTISEALASTPELASLFNNAYQKAVKEKETIVIEYQLSKDAKQQCFQAKFNNLSEPGAVSILISDITKRKNAELALLQNQQILNWSSMTAKIGGWELDIATMTLHWSDEIYRIREIEKTTKTSLEEAFQYYDQSDRGTINNALREALIEGIAWDLELSITTGRGNKKWVRDIGIPKLKGGKCVALRGVMQDITEKKNAQIALQLREQELELAVKGADLGIWDWNIVTDAMRYNNRWANMLGYNLKEIEPHISAWENLVHPDDIVYVRKVLNEHLIGKTEFYETEHRVKHKHGHWLWVLDKGKVVERDANGKPLRASGTHLDITDRKTSELKNLRLQLELEEFKAAVSAATIVSITDLQGNIKYANQKFEAISQYTRKELIHSKHNIVNSGYHSPSFWKNMWQTITAGNTWRAEVKNKRKDGTYYWVDTFIIPLKNTENQITEFLSIRNDITEKKENEVKLSEALKRAEESDRLKSAFLANISHEIRTPMNAIMGFAELLDRPNLSDQKRFEFSKLIIDRSQDLLTVVNDILDISKLEAGHLSVVPVCVDINELFHRLLLTFHAESFYLRNKKISIFSHNELPVNKAKVMADFIRLYQVLSNLLANASKFTNNGSIEFGCRFQDHDVLLFWVRDSGIGIPATELSAIFKPFQQATESIHQNYGGSGLGLAICKGLIELWGGNIWVKSEVGVGSTFYFTMPYIPATNHEPNHFVFQPPSGKQLI